jgi:hypothetical protein
MTLSLTRYSTATEFLDRTKAFLLQHEAINNLPLGVLGSLVAHPERFKAEPYLVMVEQSGVIVAVAVRTPPNNLALALTDSRKALALIARDVSSVYPDLPSVMGPLASIQPFAEHWQALTGRRPQTKMAMGIYQLTRVIPPAGIAGRFRMAHLADQDLLVQWRLAFAREALGEEANTAQAAEVTGFILRNPGESRGVGVWEDAGRVVAMAVYTGPTPNGIRIGGVYTPPDLRGHGYASACVAALSQRLLGHGRKFVFLFTDLSNPTSNKIYQHIGYEAVGEAAEVEFVQD